MSTNKTIKFKGSIIGTSDYQCAVVKVPQYVVNNQQEAEDAYKTFKPLFKFLPLVFMVDNGEQIHRLFGETEAVRFVEQYPHNIQWGEFQKNI